MMPQFTPIYLCSVAWPAKTRSHLETLLSPKRSLRAKAKQLSRAALEDMPITSKSGIERLDVYTQCTHLLHDTIDVACPCGRRTLGIVNGEVCHILQIDRIHVTGFLTIRADFCHDALLNSTGENEAPVIVGMFADKVDATRGSIDVTGLAIEMLFYLEMSLKYVLCLFV